jgi:hypothetical protein
MELFDNLVLGFSTALLIQNVLYCFVGVLLGTAVGVLPGIMPVFGQGRLLFENLPPEHVELDLVRTLQAPKTLHLRYEVNRG